MDIGANIRRAVFREFAELKTNFFGELSEVSFLDRLYNLAALPSTDPRYATAREDIISHLEHNDWPEDWLLDDPRFDLSASEDATFLRFVEETLDPLVRPDRHQANAVASRINNHLRPAGFVLTPAQAGGPFSRVRYAATSIPPSPTSVEVGFPLSLEDLLAAVLDTQDHSPVQKVVPDRKIVLRGHTRAVLADYDNWNGGTRTWTIEIHLPASVYAMYPATELEGCEKRLTALSAPFFARLSNDRLTGFNILPELAPVLDWRKMNEGDEGIARVRPSEQPKPPRKSARSAFQDLYILEAKPIGRGGFAEVFRAVERATGNTVAYKKLRSRGQQARQRMRREIDEQRQIAHRHVVPILAYAPDHTAFTMPCAEGDLLSLRQQLSDEELGSILRQISDGLAAAHARGLVHRDVTPGNILRMGGDGRGEYWTISDFGLVRRPLGKTTHLRTEAQELPATFGFSAPELADEPHAASPAVDVYSLGRVAAWFVTKQRPVQNVPLLPQGRWRHFVRETTEADPRKRPGTMAALLELIRDALGPPPSALSPAEEGRALEEQLQLGRPAAIARLVELCSANPDDAMLFCQVLGGIGEPGVRQLVMAHATTLPGMMTRMRANLDEYHAQSRPDINYWSTPLRWFFNIADTAADTRNYGLLEDAASHLFECEAVYQRFQQRHRTRSWLVAMVGEAAETVARSLRRFAAARTWYLDEGWRPMDAAPAIRRAFEMPNA